MKEIYEYYAKCNKAMNAEMLGLIHSHIENPYEHELKGYFFKSLGLLLEHVYVSDMNWMKAFIEINDHGMRIEEVGIMPEAGRQLFFVYDDYATQREKLDLFVIRYMSELDELDLAETVSRMTKKQGKIERIVWKALIHFFNHQTHHRGK